MADRTRKLFETLVRENEGALTAYLRTLIRDPGMIDDLFQETLITAWRKFDDFDQSRPLGPWLRGIALNLSRNAVRKRKREALVFSDELAQQAEAAIRILETREGDTWEERLSALSACLEKMPELSRNLIRMRYADGQNASAIAEQTQRSSTAVRKQLERIRRLLADCLRHRLPGVLPSP